MTFLTRNTLSSPDTGRALPASTKETYRLVTTIFDPEQVATMITHRP